MAGDPIRQVTLRSTEMGLSRRAVDAQFNFNMPVGLQYSCQWLIQNFGMEGVGGNRGCEIW